MFFQAVGLVLLACFYGVYFWKMLKQKRAGIRTDQLGIGKKGPQKWIEISLKILTISVPLAEVISLLKKTVLFSVPFQMTGLVLATAGFVLFAASVFTMKDNWRAGVSSNDHTSLVTNGLYRFSRNPAFLGFDLVYAGFVLMFGNLPLLIFSAAAMLLFHLQIVVVEEKYLLKTFGEDYERYCQEVCRYLGRSHRRHNHDGHKPVGKYGLMIFLLFIVVYLLVQGVRCHAAVSDSEERLKTLHVQTAHLSYGDMTYLDEGEGDVILSVHGIFGGYDQAYDTCLPFCSDFRVIAPSRFGYLGSDVKGSGTPAEQADAFCELLDELSMDKVYVLATSAGGSAAIQFALRYPERTKGLILYSAAVPSAQKPDSAPDYAGPPAFLCDDYPMFLMSPLFEPIMGMEPSTIYTMLPVRERREGVILDASVTNPDMARHYDSYIVEDLQVPTLIFQAKDDKLIRFDETAASVARFPNVTFVSFDDGGHLMKGHEEEIRKKVLEFTGTH